MENNSIKEIKNTDPIGKNAANDYTANRPDNLATAETLYNDGKAPAPKTSSTQLN